MPADRVDDLEPALALTPAHLEWSSERLGDFPLEESAAHGPRTDRNGH